jgi:PleD family two-component response regulator
VRGYRELSKDLEYEFGRATRYRHPLSVVLVSLDDPANPEDPAQRSDLNPLGDQVLDIFQRGLRSVDLIYRLQQDEFLLMFPETSGVGSRVALERLRDTLRQTARHPVAFPTFSAALVASPNPKLCKGQDILEAASILLRESRWNGSDRLVEFGKPV